MKKNLCFWILLLISVNAFAQKKAYKAAIEENSIVSYKVFVEKYPNSKYIEEILLRLEDLEIIAAKEKNEIKTYDEFLKKYPDSRYKSEIEVRLEDIFFNETKSKNTVEAYEEFLQKYPASRHKSEIESEIEGIFLNQAKKGNTVEAYGEFLKKYPASKHKSEIEAWIEDTFFNQTKEKNTIEGYDEFLNKYPDSRHKSEIENAKFLLMIKKETPRIESLDSIEGNDIDIIVNAFLQSETKLSAADIYSKISARSFETRFIRIYLINTVQITNTWIYSVGGSSDNIEKIKTIKREFKQTHESLLRYLEFFSKVLEENRKYDADIITLINSMTYREGVLLGSAKQYKSHETISYLETFLPNAVEKYFSKFNLDKK